MTPVHTRKQHALKSQSLVEGKVTRLQRKENLALVVKFPNEQLEHTVDKVLGVVLSLEGVVILEWVKQSEKNVFWVHKYRNSLDISVLRGKENKLVSIWGLEREYWIYFLF